jgi:hypothetical protein
MPKTAKTKSEKMRYFVTEFGDVLTINKDIKTNNEILFCQSCMVRVSCDQKSQVKHHIESGIHMKSIKNWKSKQKNAQELIVNDKQEFNRDLCQLLVSLNIPLEISGNNHFRQWISKYTQYSAPDPNALRINHIKQVYDKFIEEVRQQLEGQYIWISIDETKDWLDRYVCIVIVGSLNSRQELCKRFVLNMEIMPNKVHSTVVQCINNALMVLWPSGICYDRVLLLLTDGEPTMRKAGEVLQSLFPKMTHMICLAHGVHNVCETLMSTYTNVNRLISCGKKIIIKSYTRRQLFKDMFPTVPIPPEPVKTRWGHWISAVEYYTKYFEEFTAFISSIDSQESCHIRELQTLLKDKKLINDLVFINSNYDCLAKFIKQLEANDVLLIDNMKLINNIIDHLKSINDSTDLGLNRFVGILEKNPGYDKISLISKIISGKQLTSEELEVNLNLTPEEISSFKYSPITNCEVERAFSRFKHVFNERKFNLTEANLKYHLIIYCNSKFLKNK